MSNKFWTELVHRLHPYVPGEQRLGQDVVKLNTNENPYPPSDKVFEALRAVDGHTLRRYPDPESNSLRETLAEYHKRDKAEVFVGNGSDEILGLAFMAFFTGREALQYPELSYSFYPVYCDLLNIQSQVHSLNSDFSIDMHAFENNGGGIVFPNPNAPTSLAVPLDAIEALLQRVPDTLVLVDEAYVDFGAQSAIPLIDKYDNLLVSHTFSKSRSLAGMRLGAAFGQASVIDALNRVKNSFNSYPVDAMAQAAGQASLNDDAYYRLTINNIIKTRDNTTSELRKRGFTVLDSASNFIFASPPNNTAGALFEHLSASGILVRYWNTELLSSWLRISIGTDDDMAKLLSEVDAFSQQQSTAASESSMDAADVSANDVGTDRC